MISQLEFQVEGMGQTFRSPYEPVTAISYDTSFGGDVSRGVENSAGTDKAQPTGLVYRSMDFGEFGSDEITLAILRMIMTLTEFKSGRENPGRMHPDSERRENLSEKSPIRSPASGRSSNRRHLHCPGD